MRHLNKKLLPVLVEIYVEEMLQHLSETTLPVLGFVAAQYDTFVMAHDHPVGCLIRLARAFFARAFAHVQLECSFRTGA